MRVSLVVAGFLLLTACGELTNIAPEMSCRERSAVRSARADSLFLSGDYEEAAEMYFSAALLLQPGSPERRELAEKAAEVAVPPSPAVARLLLSESPDPRAPFRAILLGGAAVTPDILSGLNAGKYRLPDYVALLSAESLLAVDPAGSVQFLNLIRSDLPGRAGTDRLLATYRAALGTGDLRLQELSWDTAFESDDDQLKSRLYHYRGMARGRYGFGDFVASFNLWPAGDIHAAAYEFLRDTLLADSSLSVMVADAFYSGGLWNELYDLALNSPNPPAHVCYLGARTRDRLGMYDTAVQMLTQYLEKWPGGDDASNATIYLARDHAALGDVDTAMELLDRYETLWPSDRRISNLPWYRGSLLAENGLWDRSIPYFARTTARYPSNSTADDAQFYGCLALLKTGRTEEAIEAFGNFNSRWTRSVYRPSSRYWYGVLKMESGDETGRGVLERLIDDKPESLPAKYAREYLGLPPWRPSFTQESLESWMVSNGKTPALPPQTALDGLVLLEGGCRAWALDLFRMAEDESGGACFLAPFYLANDVWERGPAAAWQIWSLGGTNRPLDLWRLRYPDAWSGYVVPTTHRFGMDPLLLWSIMKQESAFQPSCYSTAGARGLIQMIPSTSEYVAIDNGWSESYSPDILYDPATSILYGTACISDYGQKCDWDVPGTLASYNGGVHNALRWGLGACSPEEFFSRITYNETKKYVEIVSHNYDVYRAIWPEYN